MNIVIMGGGKVGESLARRILEGRRHEVRIIESDRARSLQLANSLDVEIICGDGTNIACFVPQKSRQGRCRIFGIGADVAECLSDEIPDNRIFIR